AALVEAILHRHRVWGHDRAWGGRVDAEDVLGHVHTDSADQADLARVLAQHAGHGRQAVHHVVAACPTGERETPRHGERARIIVAEPQRVASQIDRTGEAAVQIQVGHVVYADARSL